MVLFFPTCEMIPLKLSGLIGDWLKELFRKLSPSLSEDKNVYSHCLKCEQKVRDETILLWTVGSHGPEKLAVFFTTHIWNWNSFMFSYTHTCIYCTSTCLAKIEYIKEFTFMQPLTSVKYSHQQLKTDYCSGDGTSCTGAGRDELNWWQWSQFWPEPVWLKLNLFSNLICAMESWSEVSLLTAMLVWNCSTEENQVKYLKNVRFWVSSQEDTLEAEKRDRNHTNNFSCSGIAEVMVIIQSIIFLSWALGYLWICQL